jgi:methylmalonyl-CoA/ethylmalonyl-CoA epimerase
MQHVCYEVDDLDLQIRQMRAAGSVVAKPPLPAVAFDGRRIAWMFTPDRLLIELLERETGPLRTEARTRQQQTPDEA